MGWRRVSEPPAVGTHRLVLVRHGRSAHVHSGWIDTAGFRAWRQAYEAAGIVETESVPAELARLVAPAPRVLASEAPRAIASARLLAAGRPVTVSALLHELDLESLSLGRLRLPLHGWALAVGLRTLFLTLAGRYPSPPERARIEAAAALLGELAVADPLVVAVTHASFRRRLFQRLVEHGWRPEPGPRTLHHWSAWVLGRG